MEHATSIDSGLMGRGRFFKREWKHNKPHLAKSTSLPVLQLVPANRPLFTCHRCGFANRFIPLCLWCSWTSPEATAEFESAMPRRSRRITGPSKFVWKTGNPRDREERRSRESPTSASVPGRPLTSGPPVATSASGRRTDSASAIKVQDDRRAVVTATAIGRGDPMADRPSAAGQRRGSPDMSAVAPLQYSTTTTAFFSSSSPNAAVMSVQVTHTTMHPTSLPPLVTTPRTLRRKHHMTFPRQKSVRSLRHRASATSLSPQPAPAAPPVTRLGHPSRPYYTAIRPHLTPATFSRPSTPARQSTPEPAPPLSEGDRLTAPSPPPGRPSFEFGRPRRSTTSGWSLSGEMELQIALSQRREEEERGADKRGSVARGVRRIGAGLRNLLKRV
ncbi:hypothetical protein BC834DRAFT_911822 [Gloeopeniophorella convolvens]|nr:hypothetical protein BC834DRAFT_911822 [Gloeopeniophorella convolvens]